MTDVSVVMPMYNPGNFADKAVESVLNQSYSDISVIIVDDGSDEPIEGRWEDDRLRYLRHRYNKGLACARNTGILKSEGEYIAFLDHDDYWHSKKIEKQLKLLDNSDSDVGAVFCGERFLNDDGSIVGIRNPFHANYYRLLKNNNVPISGSSVVVKRDVFEDIGLFDGRMAGVEDWDMWLRITKKYAIDYVDEVLVSLHNDMDWEPWWGNVGGRLAIWDRYGNEMPLKSKVVFLLKLCIDFGRLIF